MPIKVNIEVREKATGKRVADITRVPWCEQIGNFNPMFCRYLGKRTLVKSSEGDLSDPFRRNKRYLASLFIEV